MKFSNGCWLSKEGTECFSPAEVHYVTGDEKQTQLCAPTYPVNHRGAVLGGINLTLKISSPQKEVFHITTYHYAGVQEKAPYFDLAIDNKENMTITDTEDQITFVSGNLSLVVHKKYFSMKFYQNGEFITASENRDLSYVKTDWRGLAYDKGEKENTYMRQRFTINVDEHFYGFGERFTPFVKNGQTINIWNEDGGTSTEQSYKNIPFYVSDRNYGVLVNHPELVSFEVGSEQVNKLQFSVAGEKLDYFFIAGTTMKEVIQKYTDISGKPSLPSPWTFGLWLSTSFTTNYDEETVMSFIDGMLERDIPLRVFHFDCYWMKEFHWCDFLWDNRVFPDPKGMLSRIKDKGLNICVWINPYIGQESVLFEEGLKGDYFIKRKNGDVWQWDMWHPGMAIVDFTNPAACDWYCSKLEALLDMGVDCFKTDFGERLPVDCKYYDGSDPEKMHNYYTYLYNKCVYELLQKKRGENDAILFARSATVGGQKFPVHWGGDCWSDYESMEESLRGGLSLTMSGFGFWSHDIGGFENTSTADVYKRWAAFGLLSTHSRLHGSSSYRIPWAYDEEAVDVVRFFTKLKASLMPYLYRNAIETSKTGIPTMRSMVLEFTEDDIVKFVDKQYMFGDSILVAPIFNDRSMAKYYLPKGVWTNYLTGEIKTGGQYYTEKVDYLSIPMFVRENSIIATSEKTNRPDYDYEKNLIYKVYSLQENQEVSTIVYNMKAEEASRIMVLKEANKVTININSNEDCAVILINSQLNSEVQNNSEGLVYEQCKEGIKVSVTAGVKTFACTIK